MSIGAPVYGTEYRILGERGTPAAVGEVGELQIGGIQVARGYLRRARLTAERFVDDPSGAGRLFKLSEGSSARWA